MKKILILIVITTVFLVTACSTHKIDIQQGNVITQEDLEKVKPGMTPRQVRFALGTPILVDSFHPDRWDYIYSLKKGSKKTKIQRVTVFFSNGTVSDIRADLLPELKDRRANIVSEVVISSAAPPAEPGEETTPAKDKATEQDLFGDEF